LRQAHFRAPLPTFLPVGEAEHRPLSRSERETLRRLVDASRRDTIDWGADLRCVGCGVEQVDRDNGEHRYAAGCRNWSDRRCKHRQRDRASALH
jgi:hypothetical protein